MGSERRAVARVAASARLGAWWLSLLAVLSACAAVSPKHEPAPADPPVETVSSAATVAAPGARDRDDGIESSGGGPLGRYASGTAGLVGLMVRTYATDPLVRPVSTVKSLGFLVKNSLVDSLNRLVVNTVQLPALKSRPIPGVIAGAGMDLERWERELDRITGSGSSSGTLAFLIDGPEFFPAFVEDVDAAKESVHLRTYIFDNDDFAIEIADLLKSRSREIEVRVMMDGLGTLAGAHAIPASLPASHEAPGSIARYLENGSGVEVRVLTNPWFMGDHCKVAIIDRSKAFLGGMNIGREYRFDWHDLMVKVEGPVVGDLVRDAERAWARSGLLGDLGHVVAGLRPPEAPVADQGYPIRILYTHPHDSQIYNAHLAAIRRARSHVYIENPYFSDDVILFELIKARRRGVDVRFIISRRGDMPLMDMSNNQAINEMLANGIRVYLYPGMTHVKAAVIDDWLTVGSANLDSLSLRVNLELNIATSHPPAVKELKDRLFQADFEKSVELKEPLPSSITYDIAEAVADVFL